MIEVLKTMQTIIKIESRQEMTKSGAIRLVYKRKEYKPGHPDYEKELAFQHEYFKKNYIKKVT